MFVEQVNNDRSADRKYETVLPLRVCTLSEFSGIGFQGC